MVCHEKIDSNEFALITCEEAKQEEHNIFGITKICMNIGLKKILKHESKERRLCI